MLTTLRIDPDAPQRWTWDGTRYTSSGGGLGEPFAHPMTEHTAVTDGTRTVIIVRERAQHGASRDTQRVESVNQSRLVWAGTARIAPDTVSYATVMTIAGGRLALAIDSWRL